jgi:hypothetical protein
MRCEEFTKGGKSREENNNDWQGRRASMVFLTP